MKIRIGFVSNSSSCSFTCPQCDTEYSGFDWDEPKCPSCNKPMITEYEAIVELTEEEKLLDYLSKKYNFNIEAEREMFNKEEEKK